MTNLEEKQRTRRFYFCIAFWLISAAIAFYSGFETGKISVEYEASKTPAFLTTD